MKAVLFLSLFILPLGVFSQADEIIPEYLEIQCDSAVISIWNIHFKELSMSEDESYPPRKLSQYTLTESQANNLVEQLKNQASYDGERANLSHYDIEIEFFENGEVLLNGQISAMTGNVDIENKLNDYSFRNNCSKTFGKYFLSILEENRLLEMAEYDEIDVEGLK